MKATAIFSNYGMRLWKWTLQKFFGFDKWHIVSLRQRKYARDIIRYVNRMTKRNTIAEIGCGLGDIIRNVKFKTRFGFDNDERVLKAASFLTKLSPGAKITYSLFSFPESELSGKYDVLVMVNWIHHIEPSILKAKLAEYFRNTINAGGAIILDTVQDKEYRFNHDIHYLTDGMNVSIEKVGDYERQRQIWAIINKAV